MAKQVDIATPAQAYHMTFSRARARAEVGRTPLNQKDYADFIRLLHQGGHLDKMGELFPVFPAGTKRPDESLIPGSYPMKKALARSRAFFMAGFGRRLCYCLKIPLY